MRIAYVGPFPPHRGGIAQHGQRTTEALRALGHSVEVISWRALYPKMLVKGVQPRITANDSAHARFSLQWWNPFSWIAAGFSTRKTDLIVFSWATPAHAIALRVIAGCSSGTTAVAMLHNPEPHEPMPCSQVLLKLLLRRTAGVVVHSEVIADQVGKIAPTRGARGVRVTPHPPNLPVKPTALPPHPPLRLLMLGFVRSYKGIDLAIDAVGLGIARGLELELTVAGDFWQPPERLLDELKARGLKKAVNLQPGYVPDDKISELLAAHHILIAPYRSATVSGVIPLAHAAGRPVVATPVGGLPEAVTNGVNGIVADAVDAESFLNAIERATSNLDALATAAPQSAGDWANVAHALISAAAEPAPKSK